MNLLSLMVFQIKEKLKPKQRTEIDRVIKIFRKLNYDIPTIIMICSLWTIAKHVKYLDNLSTL